MTRQPQDATDDSTPPVGWPALAAAVPLAGAATPRYLQRFSYLYNDRVRVFDEHAYHRADSSQLTTDADGPPPVPNKRTSLMRPGDGPSPKRREKDLEMPYRGELSHPDAPTSEAGSESEALEQQFLESPSPQEHAAHSPEAAAVIDHMSPPAIDGEPGLPSPTASPRSPSPAQQSAGVLAEDSGDVEDSLAIATPRTTTDLQDLLASARAFAPSTSLFYAAPPSPLPPHPRALIPQPQPLPSEQQDLTDGEIIARMAAISHTFQELPQSLRRFQLFHLFRGCSRGTLSAMFSEIESALRFDILGHIPSELSSMVLRHLDVHSVMAAAQVCKTWYRLADSDELLWQSLLEKGRLFATTSDIRRAIRERWGYDGWPTPSSPNTVQPLNAIGLPVNIYKATFRRLSLIHKNWMRPTTRPRQYQIQCPDREVITCLDFSEDIIIASTEGKKHLNVYDTRTGVLMNAFTSHDGGVWALKRVGKDTIVSGSTDHTVRIWSLHKNRCTHVFRGHRATVRCLDVVMPLDPESPGSYPIIITGSRDTTLRLWRLPGANEPEYSAAVGESSAENPYFLAELRGHEDSVRAVSGHGTVAVSGSYDSKVRVWDLTTRTCRHVLEGHDMKVYATIIDADRNRCLSASLDKQIKVWDLETGSQLYSLGGHTALVGLLGLRDNTLVSAAADMTLRIWNPEDGRVMHRLVGHDTAILCFDHDRWRVVSGSERHLKLWDARSGEFVRDLLTEIEHIWQVKFDSRRCIAAVARGNISYLEIFDFDVDPNQSEEASSAPTERSSLVECIQDV